MFYCNQELEEYCVLKEEKELEYEKICCIEGQLVSESESKDSEDFIFEQSCNLLEMNLEGFMGGYKEYYILILLRYLYSLKEEISIRINKFELEEHLIGMTKNIKEKSLFDSLERICLSYLIVEDIGSNYAKLFNVIEEFKYIRKTDTLSVTLDKDLSSLFYVNKENKTAKLDLNLIYELRSLESIRIYELYMANRAYQNNYSDDFSFLVEFNKLKKCLGVPECCYVQISDLKKRTIANALKDLERVGIKLEVNTRKDNKKKYLEFSIVK